MKKLTAIIFFILLTFYSCNAPRDNPLDPYSSKTDMLTIEGKVENFSPPFSGLPGVSVFWAPENILVKTDNNGSFKIENVKPKEGLLIFSKKGYLSDSVTIKWDGAKHITQKVNLNKIPTLDSLNFYSVVIKQSDSSLVEQLNLDAKVVDPDNDIDSVIIKNDQLNFSKKLDFNVSEKHYQTEIASEELKTKDLEEIVGLDFNIFVYDVFNRRYDVGTAKLIRVIKSSAEIISPANGDTVKASPLLSWKKFNASFEFTYSIEIFNDNSLMRSAIASTVYREDNISSDITFLDVKKTLQTGNYFWIIWVVDKFNNTSRSFNSTFFVE